MPIVEVTIATTYCIAKTALAKFLSHFAIIGGTKIVTTAVATGCVATTSYIFYGSVTLIIVGGAIIIKIAFGEEDSEELRIAISLQNYINSIPDEKRRIIIGSIREWINSQETALNQREAIRAVLFIDYVVHPYNGNVDRNVELSETDENKWVCCICYDEYDPEDIITYEPCNHARLCFKCNLINNLTRIQKAYLRQTIIPPRCPLDRMIIDRSYKSS